MGFACLPHRAGKPYTLQHAARVSPHSFITPQIPFAVFSSDKNIETIGQLLSELRRHAELRAELFKVNAVSKLSKLLTVLLLGIILILLISLALWFVSMMLAAVLGEWLESQALGYAIVVAGHLLLALVVYLRRKAWIEAPLTHFLGELFLSDHHPNSNSNTSTPSSL